MPFDRRELAKVVRDAWVACARQKHDSPPHHLLPFEELDEWNQEVDARIGEAVVNHVINKIRVGLDAKEVGTRTDREFGIHCGGCQGHE